MYTDALPPQTLKKTATLIPLVCNTEDLKNFPFWGKHMYFYCNSTVTITMIKVPHIKGQDFKCDNPPYV